MIKLEREKYYSYNDIIEDLESKGVKHVGWCNGGAKVDEVEGDDPISLKPNSTPFGNTYIYYFPLSNQCISVDMS